MTRVVAAVGIVMSFALTAVAQKEIDEQPVAVAQNIAPARVVAPNGAHNRYRTLLRTIEAPDDRTTYGDFYNYGYWPGTSYMGQTDLPPGYWVYLSPKWYIFKEPAGDGLYPPQAPRAWEPEQATGAPDTWPKSGDIGTAWASKTPDGQREWLELTYDAPLRPVAIMIYETCKPGAVDRICGYAADGKEEVELWHGVDPTKPSEEKGISVIPLHSEFDLTRIRIYLDSQRVEGWNEIDAVGLLDAQGKIHWAVSATASSTYADQGAGGPPTPIFLDTRELENTDRLDILK